jgi:tripartite-type tricarboxylate transporter receptor subunit TctC
VRNILNGAAPHRLDTTGEFGTCRVLTAPIVALLSMTWLAVACTAVHAGAYPERTVRVVVPFPAGGPTDVAARVIAQSLSSRLGQNVVVENVVGAAGRIGARAVASAHPDGYTLLLGGTNINAIARSLYKDPGFDPINSFAPVAAICADSMALAINPNVPAQTFEEFVQYARNNPGKLKFGAPPGIYTHIAGELFKVKTGTDILFVPYKGAAPAITDLLGGHIEMIFNNKSTLLTHFKEGKLRPIAVTSERRWPELPDVPTMSEVGVAGFPNEIIFGLLAPAGTPPDVLEKLNRAVGESLRSADVRASLGQLGMEAKNGTARDFAEQLQEQARNWKAVIDATGVKLD